MTNRESERMKAAECWANLPYKELSIQSAHQLRNVIRASYLAGGEHEYEKGFEACKQKMLEQIHFAIAAGCDVSIRTDWFSKTIEQLTPTGPGEGEE